MSNLIYYAVCEHLKTRKLTFDLLAFQLGLSGGDVAIALIQMCQCDKLNVVYMSNGEPVFCHIECKA